MFCYQCEQTSQNKGCSTIGVCGKDETTAALQDLLIHAAKAIAMYAHRARQCGAADPAIDAFVADAIFATLTNVNFDPERLTSLLMRAAQMRDKARSFYEANVSGTPDELDSPANWTPASTIEDLCEQGRQTTIPSRLLSLGSETANLQEMILYGIKGVAAYMAHTNRLAAINSAAYATMHEVLDFLTWSNPTADQLLATALKVGELNYRVMEQLDRANTDAFGHPQPVQVRLHARKGKAIVISGHDLADLQALLEQTKGLGIQIYTHGEMLPAHGYPKLKAYSHLAGHYGGAWMDQAREFEDFPGAILMTSNCIQRPKDTYQERIFTCGPTAWPGVHHISDHDFSPVIAAALEAPGYDHDGPADEITVGFGRQAVLGVADKVIDAVKAGSIRHFFLIGGCDGAKTKRDYYRELAESVPEDCVILTLACGKFRFNRLEFGEVAGLPRLLDIGQCNDSYSAIQIALALANAFDCGVNDLPLSLVLSWYEQKAVAILLTLLHLGVCNIRIGPSLPAFITPGVLALLHEKFNLMPITTPELDLAAILKQEPVPANA